MPYEVEYRTEHFSANTGAIKLKEFGADREAKMITQLEAVMRPVLIPMEEQSMQIQAENTAIVRLIARDAWRAFIAAKS